MLYMQPVEIPKRSAAHSYAKKLYDKSEGVIVG